MNTTGNKKAQTFDGQGLIEVITKKVNNMSTIQQNLLNPNKQPLIIGEFSIRQDEDGRYCINDLHKAGGGLEKHKPSNFLRNEQTKDLITEIEKNFMMLKSEHHNSEVINVIRGRGKDQGTYVVEDLVYSYAMWISAKFHLMVIRAYRSLVTDWVIGGKQTISPEQCGILYNIVHTRAKGNGGTIANMWSRLKNHFKYSASYRELRAIHFEDAKHYLEVMEIKIKAEKPVTPQSRYSETEIQELAWNMVWLGYWWKKFGKAFEIMNPNVANSINEHFTSGAWVATSLLSKDEHLKLKGMAENYPWHLSGRERILAGHIIN